MAIDDTSPAYDAGDDATCEAVDQRGLSRPRSLHCDIGAYEYVKPSANLGVATTVVGQAVAGADVDFRVEVHNDGPTPAVGVTLADVLPTGATYVAMPDGHGFTCGTGSTLTCTNPLMVEGATALLTLTVRLPAGMAAGTSLTNTATVGSLTPDPVAGNNTSYWTTSVLTRADVSVTKSGPTAPVAGTDVSYTLVARNDGPSTARTVTVSDSAPAGTTPVSLTAPAGWSCSLGTLSCTTSAMAPGTTAALTVVLHLAPSATEASELCNRAAGSSATTDPQAATTPRSPAVQPGRRPTCRWRSPRRPPASRARGRRRSRSP